MTTESSNLSHREYFRLNGTLSNDRMENLLDSMDESQAYDVREFAAYAQDASASYPAEDFLHEQVSDLQAFAKRLRGDNKADLLHIIESISDALQCQFNSSDYGRDELRKIIATIKNK